MLARYLPEGPYRFSMAFGRGEFGDFWSATDQNSEILQERRCLLASEPAKYLGVLPEAEALIAEALELGLKHRTLASGVLSPKTAQQQARLLGENWEPDFLLLKNEATGPRLVCGCVCFPSSWALEEKMGKSIAEIHGIVPSLNENIGRQIQTFLEKLKPAISWQRNNWGLSRSFERNQHPSRNVARLDDSVRLEDVFFRVEEQSLVALPESNGILFGIRLKIVSLAGYEGTDEGLQLARALETMPEPMAVYKGIEGARTCLIRLLKG